MSHRTALSGFAALALLATPVFALADSGQPCPCTHECATHRQSKAKQKDGETTAQFISAETQQAIWTSP